MKNLCLTLFCLLFIIACTSSESGSLTVKITYQQDPIENQNVLLDPIAVSKKTNIEGEVVFMDLEANEYTVLVNHPTYGAFSETVSIDGNIDAFVQLDLDPAANLSFECIIIAPFEGESYQFGESFSFAAILQSIKYDPTSYAYVLSSNQDGELKQGVFSSFSDFQVEIIGLNTGEHELKLEVTDKDGLKDEARVNVTIVEQVEPIQLFTDSSEKLSNKIYWEHTIGDDFSRFEVYRNDPPSSSMSLYEVIEDSSVREFVDNKLLIDKQYTYRVDVVLPNEIRNESNEVENSIQAPFTQFPFRIQKVLHDSKRDVVYAISKNDNTLFKVDIVTLEIIDELKGFWAPTDMCFDDDMNFMYVPNSSQETIAVVDLDMFKIDNYLVTKPFNTQLEDNPISVAYIDGLGVAYQPIGWGWVSVLDPISGDLVLRASHQFSGSDIVSIPGQKVMFANTGSELIRFDYSPNQLQLTNQVSFQNSNANISFSSDYKYIFGGKEKRYTNNLESILGSFEEEVFASNYDGTLAFGNNFIWDAESFEVLRGMPIEAEVMCTSSDGLTLFAFDGVSEKLYYLNLDCL